MQKEYHFDHGPEKTIDFGVGGLTAAYYDRSSHH